MRFDQLPLAEPILRAVAAEGYHTATPIQVQAIPHVLAGSDLLGCAQTGTGKTAAFALPILNRLAAGLPAGRRQRAPRCLVLCPTRELATQISDSFRVYGVHLPLRSAVIFGGVNQRPQVAKLRGGVDIVIATPGRLLDLMNQGHVDLRSIETVVLDEADRMLDMGFIHDIRKITAKLPEKRQTLLFSATMPGEIRSLAATLLHSPVTVQVAAATPAADRVAQSVYFVERADKPDLLADLMRKLGMTRTIVFSRTKHGADKIVRQLDARGVKAEAIHGNKSQNARQRAMDNFRSDRIGVLVATDIAARGIDIDDISHVVNYDLSHEPETYVHRIGRTARAGAEGVAVSFCDRDEMPLLRDIERLLGQPIPVSGETPAFASTGRYVSHNRTSRPQGSRPARQGGGHTGGPRRRPAAVAAAGVGGARRSRRQNRRRA